MKKIEAIIRPEKLPLVRSALEEIGLGGLTVSQVMGHGAQGGVKQEWRGITYTVDLLNKLKLELVVRDSQLEPAMKALAEAARTGAVGDGKIFVSTVDEVMRVRTGERGEVAV